MLEFGPPHRQHHGVRVPEILITLRSLSRESVFQLIQGVQFCQEPLELGMLGFQLQLAILPQAVMVLKFFHLADLCLSETRCRIETARVFRNGTLLTLEPGVITTTIDIASDSRLLSAYRVQHLNPSKAIAAPKIIRRN